MRKEYPMKKMMDTDVPSTGNEKRGFWITAIFVVLLVLTVVFPLNYPLPIWLVISFYVLLGGLFIDTFYDAMRHRSFAIVSNIGHASLRYPDPFKMAVEDSGYADDGNKLVFEWGIFALQGFQHDFWWHNGGGNYGYIIVPKDGWFRIGGTIVVTYELIRHNFLQLSSAVRVELHGHKNFTPNSPIWVGYSPLNRNQMQDVLQSLSPEFKRETIYNLVQKMKRLNEDAAHSDELRRLEGKRSYEIMKKFSKKKRYYIPEEEYEAKKNE